MAVKRRRPEETHGGSAAFVVLQVVTFYTAILLNFLKTVRVHACTVILSLIRLCVVKNTFRTLQGSVTGAKSLPSTGARSLRSRGSKARSVFLWTTTFLIGYIGKLSLTRVMAEGIRDIKIVIY